LPAPLPLNPANNRVLSTLAAADLQRLQPHLGWVELPAGARLYEAGSVLSHAWFPVTAVASLTTTMQDGAMAEVAVVGSEGLVGVCAFMGEAPSLSGAVVQTAGWALRMPAPMLREQSRQVPAFMRALLGYAQVLIAHMAQTSACSRHHPLDQQLCRWLLLHLDRIEGPEIAVTQERIAQMLGVRREGVTAGASKLQKAGLIRYSRGRITILDRAGIEARSCECHALVKRAHDRLLHASHRPAPERGGARGPAWLSARQPETV
jgi:CRP-like cAMP-binding protein